MNKGIQQAIELAREGKDQEAYQLIVQELKLHPANGLAWAVRAQLTTDKMDRLESLAQASELTSDDLTLSWIRREIERTDDLTFEPPTVDPYPGDPVPSPHAFDIAFLEDDTDHSMQTQAMPAPKKKSRGRGCLILLIAVVILVIIALVASIFLVPSLQQMIPF